MDDTPAQNADQIAYWNSRVGERWATLQAEIDAVFAPMTGAALAWAGAKPGDRVMDVGCGCGTTVLELARTVGPSGRVLGVDVSEPMLGVAAERVAAAGLAYVQLALADASVHRFEPEHQLVFSRFGVMFFDDPEAAFRHVRTALVPGGRLAFVCWQPLAANPWFSVPLAATLPHVPPQPPPDPLAPGPFAFADPDRVRAILTGAGFSAVTVEPHRSAMRLAGPGDLDAATGFATKVGMAARLLAEAEPEARAAAMADIRKAFAAFDGPDGITLDGGLWFVAARA